MTTTIKRSDIGKMNKIIDKFFEKQNSDELSVRGWVNANKEFILERINQGKTASDFVNALKNEFGIEVSLASFRGYIKKLKNTDTPPVKPNTSSKVTSQNIDASIENTGTLSLKKKEDAIHKGEA